MHDDLPTTIKATLVLLLIVVFAGLYIYLQRVAPVDPAYVPGAIERPLTIGVHPAKNTRLIPLRGDR